MNLREKKGAGKGKGLEKEWRGGGGVIQGGRRERGK